MVEWLEIHLGTIVKWGVMVVTWAAVIGFVAYMVAWIREKGWEDWKQYWW